MFSVRIGSAGVPNFPGEPRISPNDPHGRARKSGEHTRTGLAALVFDSANGGASCDSGAPPGKPARPIGEEEELPFTARKVEEWRPFR